MPFMVNKTCVRKYQSTVYAFLLILLILLILLLFFNAKGTLLTDFSLIDSAVVLAQGLMYSPFEYFTSPYSYQFLSQYNLTPWVTLSWGIDYQLFGVDSLGFRIHHLLSMTMMILLIFLVLLRFYVSPVIAFVFSWATGVTPGALEVATLLQDRHYIEGLIFCLLSVLCVIKYNQKKKFIWLIFSAFFYLMAATAKEIYVPLPGVIFFMLEGRWRSRLHSIAPYAIVAAAYIGWRFYMLGGSFGGYQFSQSSSVYTQLELLSSAVAKIIFSSFGTPVPSLTILGTFTAVAVFGFSRISINAKLGAATSIALLLFPIVSLVPTILAFNFLPPRWIFLPTTVLLMYFAFLCSIVSKPIRILATLIVFGWSIYATVQIRETKIWLGDTILTESIMAADGAAYIQLDGYNALMASATSDWVNLSKLHQGQWGTLTLSVPPQQLYHDLRRKIQVDSRLKPTSQADLLVSGGRHVQNLIEVVTYDFSEQLLTFKFGDMSDHKVCYVYLFGEHNGVPLQLASCEHWQVSTSLLSKHLRAMGYTLDSASIAVWQGSGESLIASKPYRLSDLLRENGIDIKVIPHD